MLLVCLAAVRWQGRECTHRHSSRTAERSRGSTTRGVGSRSSREPPRRGQPLVAVLDRDRLQSKWVPVGSIPVGAPEQLFYFVRFGRHRPASGCWALRAASVVLREGAGHAFGRDAYLAIVLGPLVSLSALALIGFLLLAGTSSAWVIALWAVVNAGASNADLRIAALVGRYPRSATVVDERDGLRVLLPPSHARPKANTAR